MISAARRACSPACSVSPRSAEPVLPTIYMIKVAVIVAGLARRAVADAEPDLEDVVVAHALVGDGRSWPRRCCSR